MRAKIFRFLLGTASLIIGMILAGETQGPSTAALWEGVTPGATSRAASCPPTWTRIATPNVQTGNALLSLAVAGPSNVWGVGTYSDSRLIGRTLVTRWDGSAWSTETSPNGGTGNNYLSGAVAFSPTNAYAVGASTKSGKHTAVIENWNGSAWTVLAAVPNPSATQNILYAVEGTSPTDIWAVGEYDRATPFQTLPLILHWNGGSWSQFSSPSLGTGTSRFYGVSAYSQSDVWAVGGYSNGGSYRALTEHWDGSSWTVVPNPGGGTRGYWLFGVDAASSNQVWAVGERHSPEGAIRPLILFWDGSTWTDVSIPTPAFPTARLYGVDVRSATDVWAVGTYFNGAKNQTFFMHWDGQLWQAMPGDGFPNEERQLYAVAGTPGGDLWAVGSRSGHTLAYRMCPVDVLDSGFSPTSASVGLGSTATWSLGAGNLANHSIVDSTGLGLFDSGPRGPGASFVYTFTAAGTYGVRDATSSMTSEITVPMVAKRTTGNTSTSFPLTWASAPASAGFVYDVQIQRPGSTPFAAWRTGVTTATANFRASTGPGTYSFRARLRAVATGAVSGWSPLTVLQVN
jgi:hypothetical protein